MGNDYVEILMSTIAKPDDVLTFLHNTKYKNTAINILDKGFQFNSHLDYTTDCVSAKDEVTVKYFALTRQAYGQYTVIIQIAKQIIEHYSRLLQNRKHHFSELLSVAPPVLGTEDDFIYQLAPQFAKCFIDSQSGELVANPIFDPYYNPNLFKENLNRILNEDE